MRWAAGNAREVGPGSGAREALERAKHGQEAWVVEDIDETLAVLPT